MCIRSSQRRAGSDQAEKNAERQIKSFHLDDNLSLGTLLTSHFFDYSNFTCICVGIVFCSPYF